MVYRDIQEGRFVRRVNRFTAEVEIEGITRLCHVKNTGRCRELFVNGAACCLQRMRGERKTGWDLISVVKNGHMINVDSQAPNKLFAEWVCKGGLGKSYEIFPERFYGASRLDFCLKDGSGGLAYAEVKGVTLEENGIALFPDAPTERGVRHINELIRAREEGLNALLFFVVQMKGPKALVPNRKTHSAFAEALCTALEAGVSVMAYDCAVSRDSIAVDSPMPVFAGKR